MRPVLALTQGDPAGIGPEILLKLLLEDPEPAAWQPVLVAERSALEALRPVLPAFPWDRLRYVAAPASRAELPDVSDGGIPVIDPVGSRRTLSFGSSGPADAAGAMAALDAGIELVDCGVAAALVTAPVSKESIARQHLPGFVGHTDYLAEVCGLERYGRDYLMAFLAPGLQVALLNVHLPLRDALDGITGEAVGEALDCLHRHAGGRIALAGLNPHAGEGGLFGREEIEIIRPAIDAAAAQGLQVSGPFGADTMFHMSDVDAFIVMLHDQGHITAKVLAPNATAALTIGTPILFSSVAHGSAHDISGKGIANPRAMIEAVLRLSKPSRFPGHAP